MWVHLYNILEMINCVCVCVCMNFCIQDFGGGARDNMTESYDDIIICTVLQIFMMLPLGEKSPKVVKYL